LARGFAGALPYVIKVENGSTGAMQIRARSKDLVDVITADLTSFLTQMHPRAKIVIENGLSARPALKPQTMNRRRPITGIAGSGLADGYPSASDANQARKRPAQSQNSNRPTPNSQG
jgi:hypothetical protein